MMTKWDSIYVQLETRGRLGIFTQNGEKTIFINSMFQSTLGLIGVGIYKFDKYCLWR